MSSNHYRAPAGAAIIAFRRGSVPPSMPGTVRRPLRWDARSSSGRIFVWRHFSTSGGGGNIYTIFPSGGVTLSGAAVLRRERVLSISGGVAFSGLAAPSKTRTFTISGGVAFSGTAPLTRTVFILPSGGVVFSGAAPMLFIPAGGGSVTTSLALLGVGQ